MAERTGSIGLNPSAPSKSAPPETDSSSEIRQDIEQTRERMSGTIGEIQERLSPSHLKDQVKEQVRSEFYEAKSALRAATIGKVENMIRDTGNVISETQSSIWQTIKDNPVPSALAAVGLTWLFVNRRGGSSRGGSRFEMGSYPWRDQRQTGYRVYGDGKSRIHGENISGAAGETLEQAKEKAGELKEKAGELAEQAQEKVGEWVDQGKQQARRVESQFRGWMDTNPVALGAVALTLGTAVGLALPRTEKEDEWLGEARDSLVEKAQNLAGEAVDKAKEVATQGSSSGEKGNRDQQQSSTH